MRCPACGRPADTLDARSVMRLEAKDPLGSAVTTESQVITQCGQPPNGCGSRRIVWRSVTVRDQGETRRRSIPSGKSQ